MVLITKKMRDLKTVFRSEKSYVLIYFTLPYSFMIAQ